MTKSFLQEYIRLITLNYFTMFDIQIIGIKFSKPNQYGDFEWMCNQDKYKDSLFIFNDNEEHHETCREGGGNAVMRKYNKYSDLNVPKSAGIPTGSLIYGGYQILNTHSKTHINNAINEIILLIRNFRYKYIYYSSELDGKLGTSIFQVNDSIIQYITRKIFKLSNQPIQIVKTLPNNYFDQEINKINNCVIVDMGKNKHRIVKNDLSDNSDDNNEDSESD